MKLFKNMNDIESTYDSGLIEERDKFRCPVCEKTYKQRKSGEKHIARRDCADLKSLFKGTITEMYAYQVYRDILLELYKKEASFVGFRKSPAYKPSLRYMAFLEYYGITGHTIAFAIWAYMVKDFKHPTQLLTHCTKKSVLDEYIACINHYELIDSVPFVKKFVENIDEYDNPSLELIRGLEKAKMCVYDIVRIPEILDVFSNMPVDYKERYGKLLTAAEEYK